MLIPRFKFVTKKRLKQLERNIGSEKYQIWRKTVLERDNNTCQWPGCTNKDKLEVHHIKPYSRYLNLRFNPYNGITLCKECHQKTFGKEDFYAVMLTKKVFSNADKKENKDNI